MTEGDDEFCGYVTPADKALEGFSNVIRIVLARIAMVLGWVIAIALAAYYAATSTNGSYSQGLAINLLASLLLVALAPFVIDFIATRRKTFWALAAATVGVLVGAYFAERGWRDFLLNVGSGLGLLLGVEYYVSRRFSDWTKKMEERAERMGKMPSHPVLF
jgi:hypothetical protein